MCEAKTIGGMGFRDIEAFNKVLLGKQGWRLIKNVDSLMFRVVKNKYFPTTSFQEAELGHKPSFIWRSIFSAKDLIQRGSRWRVGNGCTIRVWQDVWMPNNLLLSNEFAEPSRNDFQTVSDFIIPTNGGWNRDLLRECFVEEDVDLICGIPLSRLNVPDTLVWHLERNGIYSVKSGYRILKSPTGSNHCHDVDERDIRLWKFLWKANVPQKVKVFGWKMCRDFLPVYSELAKKKLLVSGLCPRCNTVNETTLHAIRECTLAEEVWRMADLSEYWMKTGYGNTKEWMLNIVEKVNQENFDQGLFLCWAIWNSRNKAVKAQTSTPPNVTVLYARSYLHDHQQAQMSQTGATNRELARWNKPDRGLIKVNFDGAVHSLSATGGTWVVIRDNEGMVLGAASDLHYGTHDALTMECFAAIKALRFASELGHRKIILEGDSQQVLRLLNDEEDDLSPIGNLILEGKLIMKSFEQVEFNHVMRDGNTVADKLAKHALVSKSNEVWFDVCPVFVTEQVKFDCNLSLF